MTAADQLARDAIKTVTSRVTARIALGVVLVASLALSYCQGKQAQRAADVSERADSMRKVDAAISKGAELRIDQRAPLIAKADTVAKDDRVKYEKAKTHVVIVSDTVIQVDSVTVDIPMPAVEVMRSAEETIRADSVLIAALHSQLADMEADRNAWYDRAHVDEQELKALKPSRFGFKTGLALGATAVALLVHLLK